MTQSLERQKIKMCMTSQRQEIHGITQF